MNGPEWAPGGHGAAREAAAATDGLHRPSPVPDVSLPRVARSQAGVTLVELSVTLVIIAVLAVMAVSATGLLGQALLGGRVKGASEELATATHSTRELAEA